MTGSYLHGSSVALPVGTLLRGRGAAYIADWSGSGFYSILEAHRPAHCLAHAQAVFMVGADDDLDCAGGATDWVFTLKPCGPVTRHDMNWSSEICYLISEGISHTGPEIAACAAHYWAGTPHPNESVWEYLTAEAEVLACAVY